MELIILLPIKKSNACHFQPEGGRGMHKICGVRRIVPVRSIGHKKRQKELWKGVTLDGRALDVGVLRRALFPVAWRLSRN
jgi:hypothetical protein